VDNARTVGKQASSVVHKTAPCCGRVLVLPSRLADALSGVNRARNGAWCVFSIFYSRTHRWSAALPWTLSCGHAASMLHDLFVRKRWAASDKTLPAGVQAGDGRVSALLDSLCKHSRLIVTVVTEGCLYASRPELDTCRPNRSRRRRRRRRSSLIITRTT
jgi:hypothetical protein